MPDYPAIPMPQPGRSSSLHPILRSAFESIPGLPDSGGYLLTVCFPDATDTSSIDLIEEEWLGAIAHFGLKKIIVQPSHDN